MPEDNGNVADQERRAFAHVAETFMESGGDVALCAKRLGWTVEEVRANMDAIYLYEAEQLESPEGQKRERGRNHLTAKALTAFAMDRMRTSDRAGHRWGGLALAGLAHQDKMGSLALTSGEAGMPTVVVINGEVPKPMAIEATGDGSYRSTLPAGVPVSPESAEPG